MTLLAACTTVVGSGAAIAAFRLRRGPALTPFVLTMAVLVSIYGIRPLLELRTGRHEFHGIDVSRGVHGAAAIGLIGVVAGVAGYAVARRRLDTTFGAVDTVPESDTHLDLRTAAAVGLVMLALWTVAIALAGGGFGFVPTLFRGRSAETLTAIQGLPEAVFALSPAAAILVSAQRIRIERVRSLRPAEHVAFAVVVVASIVPPIALGSRRYLLPGLIVAAVALVMPTWNRRIRLRATVAVAAALLALVSIPYARTTTSGTVSNLGTYLGSQGVAGAVEQYFVSYDTEMFGYTAYLHEHLGRDLDHGLGRWFLVDGALALLPHQLAAATGIEPRSAHVMTHMIGHDCDVTRACPVGGIIAIGYFEFDVAGVVLLLALWGALCARAERALFATRGVRFVAVLAFVGFTPMLVRGNTVNQLWILANVWFLTALADQCCTWWHDARRQESNGTHLAAGPALDAARST